MNDLKHSFGKVVQIKRGCDWQEFDTARLQISVGQEYHEGEKLAATLEWASSNFKKVIICVNDTLQRHNFMFHGADADTAFKQSEEAGREWIERNIETIRAFPNVGKITRWEQWRNHEDTADNRKIIDKMYADIPSFKKSVEDEIQSFWQRLNRDGLYSDKDAIRFADHSREYLLEECAAFKTMFATDKAADVYPGSSLLPCSELKGMGQYGFTKIAFKDKKPKVA